MWRVILAQEEMGTPASSINQSADIEKLLESPDKVQVRDIIYYGSMTSCSATSISQLNEKVVP